MAGVGSVFPAASVARTLNAWVPGARSETVCGEAHAAYAPPSNRHWNVPPVSVETKANVAWVPATVPLGPEVIVVSGAAVSTVHAREAGVGSVLPARSTARTSKVWLPSPSPDTVAGDVQAAKAAPSRRHS